MPEKKVEEKEEKPYLITISDWLQYLQHESSVNSNHLFSYRQIHFVVLAILLSLSAIFFSFGKGFLFGGVEIGIIMAWFVFLFSVYVFITTLWFISDSKYVKKRDSAEKILVEILIERKYQTIEEIEERWKKELEKIKSSSGWFVNKTTHQKNKA